MSRLSEMKYFSKQLWKAWKGQINLTLTMLTLTKDDWKSIITQCNTTYAGDGAQVTKQKSNNMNWWPTQASIRHVSPERLPWSVNDSREGGTRTEEKVVNRLKTGTERLENTGMSSNAPEKCRPWKNTICQTILLWAGKIPNQLN